MALTPGTRLGPYAITTQIGVGGMGEVYRATDTNLGRDVAIKVLPEAFAQDSERLARFEREAKTLAALNHPNIATIHGLEKSAGAYALVMELVEGPTLAERIAEEPIPVDQALPIAKQIAEALEAAHEQGIIHRDLKPANVKVRPDGTVKVLDFGLAKAMEPVGAATSASASMSPTITTPAMTQAGMILGTAAYMSPEQARGKPVDRRADIWAFGCVLYEMLSGRRPFDGEDLTETLASVVKVEPDLSVTPLVVRRLLAKCLQKDPRQRLRDIGDAWDLLDQDRPRRPGAAELRLGRLWLWPAAAVVLGIVAVALAIIHIREVSPAVNAVQFSMEPPVDNPFVQPYGGYAPSPDGRYFVFSSAASASQPAALWIRPLDSLSARPLLGTEGGNFPTWSPDGRSLAFLAAGKLKRIDLEGGAPVTLGDMAVDAFAAGAWNQDGVILFGSSMGLRRFSVSAAESTFLTTVDPAKKETGHSFPQFLPDGNRFVYLVASTDPTAQGLYLSALDRPDERQLIMPTANKAVYAPPNGAYPSYLLWMQEQTLVAQRFDLSSLRRDGAPVPLAENVALGPDAPRAAFYVSDSGLLTYLTTLPFAKRTIIWMGRDGQALGDALPPDRIAGLSLSPDSSRLAFTRFGEVESGAQDVWAWEFARQTLTRLTFASGGSANPVWSPDGRQVAFNSEPEAGTWQIYRKNASGAGEEEQLTDGPLLKVPLDWSPGYLLFRQAPAGPTQDWDLFALPFAGDAAPMPIAQSPFNESIGRISPDERWLAFASNDSGRQQIYIQAFPVPGVDGRPVGRWQISSAGGSDMKWRSDGRELYYETTDGQVMAVEIQFGLDGVGVGPPRELFTASIESGALHSLDVTGDGQRFLLQLQPPVSSRRLMVVQHWQATLPR